MKRCVTCKLEKPQEEFHRNKRKPDGLSVSCKKCAIDRVKIWALNNKEKSRENYNNWVSLNRQRKLEIQKTYRDKHNEEIKLKQRIRRSKFRDSDREKNRKRQKERMLTDPVFALTRTLRRRFSDALKKQCCNKETSALKLLGCTIPELKQYLESKFIEGMTWENRGSGILLENGKPVRDENGMTILVKCWHIDHIKCCDSFDLSDLEQQKQCFHYTNLQPLWATDNISKGSKTT